MPCRRTASTIGCGSKAAKPWLIFCKTAHRKCSAPTFTPPPASATAWMLDHATGFVVGETATLGNDISILHGVTLGGSGKESGDRHPKVGDGVMIRRQRLRARQHPHRRILQSGRRQRGGGRCAAAFHRGGRAGQNRGQIGGQTGRRNGSAHLGAAHHSSRGNLLAQNALLHPGRLKR